MVPPRKPLAPWSFIVTFGFVSLLADVVYEGARSVTGPLLASLGATALLVGIVTGVGEAAALVLRLVSGTLADRTQRFWAFTIGGYALTVVTVPFFGLTGILWVTCALVIVERIGKAVRSPSKDTMISHAASVTGRGRGFAVHEALDQFGAVTGPLVVAAVLFASGGNYAPALGVLALPGVLALGLLLWLRYRVPDPGEYEPHAVPKERPTIARVPLPKAFWLYAAFTGLTTAGFATFGVLSFHMVHAGVLPAAVVPLIYAAAMGADALAALSTGWLYDRRGPVALFALPVLAAGIPLIAYTTSAPLVIAGAVLWGAALGIQESTLRARVADLVPRAKRATGYGIFAAVMGTGTFIGGAVAGALYEVNLLALILTTAAIQAVALALLITTTVRARAEAVPVE